MFLTNKSNMSVQRLAGLGIMLMASPLLLAEEPADEQGISGQVCAGYVNIDDNAGAENDTLAIGGKLGYISPGWRGLSAGATFYTTQPIGSMDDEAMFLDSNNDGYSILGQAYVNANLGATNIRLGRQEIDTPHADTDDIGMVPNTFEGLVITNESFANTQLMAAHLRRWAGVDAPVAEDFTDMNGDVFSA